MSLHARLRRDTRASHDRVEAAFDLATRLSSPAAYAALLGRLHGFHAAFERAAPPFLPAGMIPGPSRAALLLDDLAALGAAPGSNVADAFEIADRAEALGAAYVVEGSVLGGVVIARAVGERLGFGPQNGAAFFSGFGRETARTWRAFCAALDAAADPATDDRAVASAERTFGLVESCLVEFPAAVPA